MTREEIVARKKQNGCQNPEECTPSSGFIADEPTFGWGELDVYGYWEHGCYACARAFDKAHPESVEKYGPSWPYPPEHIEKLNKA